MKPLKILWPKIIAVDINNVIARSKATKQSLSTNRLFSIVILNLFQDLLPKQKMLKQVQHDNVKNVIRRFDRRIHEHLYVYL